MCKSTRKKNIWRTIIASAAVYLFIFSTSAYSTLRDSCKVPRDLRATNADSNPPTIKGIEAALDIVRWSTGKPVDWKIWEWVPGSKYQKIRNKDNPETVVEKNADGLFPALLAAAMPNEIDEEEKMAIERIRRKIENIFIETIGRGPTIEEAADTLRMAREERETVQDAGKITAAMVKKAAHLVKDKERVMEVYKAEGITTLKEMADIGEMGWKIEDIFRERIGRKPTIAETVAALRIRRTEGKTVQGAGKITAAMVKKAAHLVGNNEHVMKVYMTEGITTLKEMADIGEMGWKIEDIFIKTIGRGPTIAEAADALRLVREEGETAKTAAQIVTDRLQKEIKLLAANLLMSKEFRALFGNDVKTAENLVKEILALGKPMTLAKIKNLLGKHSKTDVTNIGQLSLLLHSHLQGTVPVEIAEKEKIAKAEFFPTGVKIEADKLKADEFKKENKPIAILIKDQLLWETPGFALTMLKIKEQFGESIKFVLAMDNPEKKTALFEGIRKATHDLVNLENKFDLVVSAKQNPGKMLAQLTADLGIKKIAIVGPEKWVDNYALIKLPWKDTVLVFCKMGNENSITQGDIALWAGLDALVKDGLLEKSNKEKLYTETEAGKVNKHFFTIKTKKVGKTTKEAAAIYYNTVTSE